MSKHVYKPLNELAYNLPEACHILFTDIYFSQKIQQLLMAQRKQLFSSLCKEIRRNMSQPDE